MTSDWTTKEWSLDTLRHFAGQFDEGSDLGAMALLKYAGVVPWGVEWKRQNRLPRFNLSREAIPALYLAEVAYSWDQEGPSHPMDFIKGLEYEVAGPDSDAIRGVLGSLGKSPASAWD